MEGLFAVDMTGPSSSWAGQQSMSHPGAYSHHPQHHQPQEHHHYQHHHHHLHPRSHPHVPESPCSASGFRTLPANSSSPTPTPDAISRTPHDPGVFDVDGAAVPMPLLTTRPRMASSHPLLSRDRGIGFPARNSSLKASLESNDNSATANICTGIEGAADGRDDDVVNIFHNGQTYTYAELAEVYRRPTSQAIRNSVCMSVGCRCMFGQGGDDEVEDDSREEADGWDRNQVGENEITSLLQEQKQEEEEQQQQHQQQDERAEVDGWSTRCLANQASQALSDRLSESSKALESSQVRIHLLEGENRMLRKCLLDCIAARGGGKPAAPKEETQADQQQREIEKLLQERDRLWEQQRELERRVEGLQRKVQAREAAFRAFVDGLAVKRERLDIGSTGEEGEHSVLTAQRIQIRVQELEDLASAVAAGGMLTPRAVLLAKLFQHRRPSIRGEPPTPEPGLSSLRLDDDDDGGSGGNGRDCGMAGWFGGLDATLIPSQAVRLAGFLDTHPELLGPGSTATETCALCYTPRFARMSPALSALSKEVAAAPCPAPSPSPSPSPSSSPPLSLASLSGLGSIETASPLGVPSEFHPVFGTTPCCARRVCNECLLSYLTSPAAGSITRDWWHNLSSDYWIRCPFSSSVNSSSPPSSTPSNLTTTTTSACTFALPIDSTADFISVLSALGDRDQRVHARQFVQAVSLRATLRSLAPALTAEALQRAADLHATLTRHGFMRDLLSHPHGKGAVDLLPVTSADGRRTLAVPIFVGLLIRTGGEALLSGFGSSPPPFPSLPPSPPSLSPSSDGQGGYHGNEYPFPSHSLPPPLPFTAPPSPTLSPLTAPARRCVVCTASVADVTDGSLGAEARWAAVALAFPGDWAWRVRGFPPTGALPDCAWSHALDVCRACMRRWAVSRVTEEPQGRGGVLLSCPVPGCGRTYSPEQVRLLLLDDNDEPVAASGAQRGLGGSGQMAEEIQKGREIYRAAEEEKAGVEVDVDAYIDLYEWEDEPALGESVAAAAAVSESRMAATALA